MKLFKRTGLALAALLLSAAAMPALAGTVQIKIVNNTGGTVTISGSTSGTGSPSLPSSTGPGTVSGSYNTTAGQPQNGVLTVKNAANTKSCSFSWSRTGQQVVGGPICGTTYSPAAIWLAPGTTCTGVQSNVTASPTCGGTITFTIQ